MVSHVGSISSFFEEVGGLFAHPYSGTPVPISSPVSFGTNNGAQVTHAPNRPTPLPFPISGPKTKIPPPRSVAPEPIALPPIFERQPTRGPVAPPTSAPTKTATPARPTTPIVLPKKTF